MNNLRKSRHPSTNSFRRSLKNSDTLILQSDCKHIMDARISLIASAATTAVDVIYNSFAGVMTREYLQVLSNNYEIRYKANLNRLGYVYLIIKERPLFCITRTKRAIHFHSIDFIFPSDPIKYQNRNP